MINLNSKNVQLLNLGDKIKYYRNLKKLTQKQLSGMTGISEIAIRKYESNQRKPKIENIIKIAIALEIPSNLLVGSDINITNLIDRSDYNEIKADFNSEEEVCAFLNGILKRGFKPIQEIENGIVFSNGSVLVTLPVKVKIEKLTDILLSDFNKLNKTGKEEAVKRVEELTQINKYTDPDTEDKPEQKDEKETYQVAARGNANAKIDKETAKELSKLIDTAPNLADKDFL